MDATMDATMDAAKDGGVFIALAWSFAFSKTPILKTTMVYSTEPAVGR